MQAAKPRPGGSMPAVFFNQKEGSIMTTRARNTFIGSLLMVTFSVGSYALIALYVVPLSEALNASIGEVSILFSVAGVGGLVASLFMGPLLKLLKIKKLIIVAAIASLLFYGSIFIANSLIVIYIGSFFLCVSTVFGGFGMAQTAITLWHTKNRGKLMSYLSIGVGVFGLAVSPVLARVIEIFGVKNVSIAHGIIVAVIQIISAALVSEEPEVYGEKPNGYEEQSEDAASSAVSSGNSLSFKQIVSTPIFWTIIIAATILSAVASGYTSNAGAIYQSLGMSSMSAAICISICSAAMLGWSPLYGFLVDKFGPGRATLVNGVIGIISLITAVFLRGFGGGIVIAALIAAVVSFVGMLAPISLPRVFGTKETGNMIGFANAAASAGSIIGPPLAGFLYDFNGSYNVFLIIAAILVVVVIIMILSSTGKDAINKINARAGVSFHPK
jgi:MFS family permease